MQLPNINSPLSMSSREIAELTGKDHRNVTRDIEKMLSHVGEGVLKFEHTYTNPQNGQSYREFHLPKDLTITLVAGYRADLRLAIVQRWIVLESQQQDAAPKVPGNFREALLLAADQQAQIESQQREINIKDATLNRITAAPTDLGIRDAARKIDRKVDEVKDFIFAKKWACMQGGKIRPAHYGREHRYTRLIGRLYTHPHTGAESISNEFRITEKGNTRMAEVMARDSHS